MFSFRNILIIRKRSVDIESMDVITILRPDNHVLSGKPKENRTRQNFRRGNPSGAGKVFRALFSGKKTPAFAAEREFAVGAFAAVSAPGVRRSRRPGFLHFFSGEGKSAAFSASRPLYAFGGSGMQPEKPAPAGYTDLRLPFLGGYIPFLVLLLAVLWLCAPVLQNRYGYAFLGTELDFQADGVASSAMNALLGDDRMFLDEKNLPDGGQKTVFPEFLEPVSFSSYTVRGGDTVSAIALRFGLDNISTILSVNGIENARRIRVGQTLRIPSADGILYRAESGDSLSSIASDFEIPVTALLDVNDLSDSLVTVGQELFVPGATLSSYDLRKAMGELFIYPIRGRLTSRFGARADPFTGARSYHTGIDLAAPTGTSIKVSTDGRVAAAGWQNIFGNYVIVTHAGGYQTLYGHMSKISVRRGQYLTQGDEVGKVGSTGYSTGPHLHFSVYKDGKMIDPFSVLD